MGKLTDSKVKSAGLPSDKSELKLSDGEGLFLLLKRLSDGSTGKYWKLAYRFNGKQKKLSIGVYPDITLKDARVETAAAKRLLADHIDPQEHKKATKFVRQESAANSFEAVAREWFAKQTPTWSESNAYRTISRLEQDIFPYLGSTPIKEIEPPQLLGALRRIESRGAIETAHRVMWTCGQVFRYAVAHGLAGRDPTPDLKGALAPMVKKSFATITDPAKVGELMRAIDSYQGHAATRAALLLAPLVFVRPGNLRAAQWDHIDMGAATWTIPASEMKLRKNAKQQSSNDHIVPLSRQALAILAELQPLTGGRRYLFPSIRSSDRPMSENTINAALRRLGFTKDDMTGHGFRHMASTMLNELGFNPDAIERQLSHKSTGVRAVYNKAAYLEERQGMMQAWADHLDSLKLGGVVIPFQRKA